MRGKQQNHRELVTTFTCGDPVPVRDRRNVSQSIPRVVRVVDSRRAVAVDGSTLEMIKTVTGPDGL